MPPGSFFVLLLVAALFWYYRRTKIAFYVFLVSIIFLYAASNPWVAAKGIGFWESRVQMQSSREKLPATIVLGGMLGVILVFIARLAGSMKEYRKTRA